MSENVILFGAGASFGSDSINTPPLGSELFEALSAFNPDGWGRLPSDLADLFRTDFETGMKQVPGHLLPPLQRVMAAYFFRFVPRRTNLYYQLAERILSRNWDGALVTINYERLLELSLMGASLCPVVGRESNAANEVEICLPHGCCHIFCDSVRGSARGISFSGRAVRTSGPVKVISDPDEFRSRIQGDAFPPVMSYFDPQKITTSGTNFITNQRERYSVLISAASSIAIVGVRVRPHDAHIWGPLAETNADIIYCSGAEEEDRFFDWYREHRKDKISSDLHGYFADCFDDLCSRIDL